MNKPKQLCIHMSGFKEWRGRIPFKDAADIKEYHINKRKFQDIAYHVIINKDGTIEQGRPVELEPASCTRHNADVWAICLIGEFNVEEPTDAQINALKVVILKQVVPEMIKNGVKQDECTDMHHIFGHCDYRDPPGRRYCPGKHLRRRIPEISKWVRSALQKGVR